MGTCRAMTLMCTDLAMGFARTPDEAALRADPANCGLSKSRTDDRFAHDPLPLPDPDPLPDPEPDPDPLPEPEPLPEPDPDPDPEPEPVPDTLP